MPQVKDFKYYLKPYENCSIPRDKGTEFEKATIYYLKADKVWKDIFKDVLTWSDWCDYYTKKEGKQPYVNRKDIGIDLVGITHNDKYYAIQCKFINYNQKLYTKNLLSFFAAIANPAKGQIYFTRSIIVDTAKEWDDELEETCKNYKVTRISLDDISNSKINWEAYFDHKKNEYIPSKILYDYQQKILDQTVTRFNELDDDGKPVIDRGKLIMACGTGKTLVSLKIAEELMSTNRNTGGGS